MATSTSDKGRLLRVSEIAEMTRLSEGSVRWHRKTGYMPFMFIVGRGLAAWEADVLAWLDEQQRADAEKRAATATAK